ncbi:MAG TPA: sugar ABC transporter ATP-binding protein [Vicinamibacteria bacterium]|nr:sugar ABC transporter ATP-binding protein [Vicinamibacteria bacterium]
MGSSAATPPRLSMRAIRKSFPGVLALDGVDLEVEPGEVHVLLGENGAGKSTLMKILSGSLGKDAGEIALDGRVVEIRGPRHAQKIGIRTIYQELNLVAPLSVAANIVLGREPGRFGMVDRRRAEEEAARLMSHLGVRVDVRRPVGELGVAQQQMVEVAKALSEEARVLVMDEPTSALTHAEIDELFATIERLRGRGASVIYISHRLEEVARIGDRVTVMRDGRRVATLPARGTPIPELVRLMVDREVGEHFPRRRGVPGEELLRVEHLTRGERLRDVSLTLRRGEIVGITGLLGAGRTELARAIVGAEPPRSGRVLLKGRPVTIRRPKDALLQGVGLVPEDRKTQGLVLGLSVGRNVALPNTRRLSRFGVVRAAAETALAGRWVRDMRVKTPSLAQPARLLSGGNQQKLVLGKWLAADVDVLIVDEPTRGIDVPAKVEIYDLMNRLTEEGKGILMISSELAEVLGMSDRVLVMREGRIAGELEATRTTQAEVLGIALGQAP